jgi:hypothetical protein
LALVGGSVALTAAVAVAFTQGLLPYGAPEWSWPLRNPVLAWGPASAVALAAAALAALLTLDKLRGDRVPSRRACAGMLALMVALGAVMMAGVATHEPAYTVTAALVMLSDTSLGYYNEAAQGAGPGDALAQHVARAESPTVPDRVRTHPPGPILLLMAVRNALLGQPDLLAAVEARMQRTWGVTGADLAQMARGGTARPVAATDAVIAVLVGWLLTLAPVLIVLPVYWLGATLADRRVGIVAALLSMTVPSLLCFIPSIDGLGAVLALSALALWAASLRNGGWLYLLAGLGAAVALLWNYGYLALLPVALLLAVGRPERRPVELGRGLLLAAAGFVAFYGFLAAAGGYSLPTAMAASLAAQREIMVREHREYLTWLALNAYGWLLFVGPALLLWFGVGWAGPAGSRDWLRNLAVGLALTLAGLLLLGSTRGEVERIWVFLMPLAALPAAGALLRLPPSLRLAGPTLVVLAQVVFALVLRSQLHLVTPF